MVLFKSYDGCACYIDLVLNYLDLYPHQGKWCFLGMWSYQSVHLHAQLCQAMVIAQLGHLIGLLSLSQYTSAEGELIYSPTHLP